MSLITQKVVPCAHCDEYLTNPVRDQDTTRCSYHHGPFGWHKTDDGRPIACPWRGKRISFDMYHFGEDLAAFLESSEVVKP